MIQSAYHIKEVESREKKTVSGGKTSGFEV